MIRVVCAIIVNAKREVLMVRRSGSMPHSGKWEFPGGKVLPDETDSEAIQREIMEELKMKIAVKSKLREVYWQYPDKNVCLVPIICEISSHRYELLEHQELRYFTLESMKGIDVLEADIQILTQLGTVL